MTPWRSYDAVPCAEQMRLYEPTPEMNAAVVAALESLFEKYPDLKPSAPWSGETPIPEAMASWREFALKKAAEGSYSNAFFHADNTGVPQEELAAVAMLLFG